MAARDAAERAQLLKIAFWLGGPMLIIGAGTIGFVGSRFHLPGWVVLLLFLSLPPLTWGAILLVERGTGSAARGLVTALHSANQEPQRTGFSAQEALVARGQLADAVALYRARLAEAPHDVEALLALGRLLCSSLGDYEGAAACFRTARRLATGPRWERAITNDLIDLYGRMGETGRLQGELARFAEANRGTREGIAAAERLRELRSGTKAIEGPEM